MSTIHTPTEPARPAARGDGVPEKPPPRRRRWVLFGSAVVVVAGVVVAATDPFASPGGSTSGSNASPSATKTVARRTLTSQTDVNGTLGYAGSYSVVDQAHGTLTTLPKVGQVVAQGQVLYRVDGSPVILLQGTTPAYRDLGAGTTTSGADVEQLNTDLVALGDATATEIPATTGTFTSWTTVAVEQLQANLGMTQTGVLTLGQVVFLPTAAARITALGQAAVLGGAAQPGSAVLTASSTTRLVTFSLDASQQSQVRDGDSVAITLPNRQVTPGVVVTVGTVATTPSSNGPGTGKGTPPSITVLVRPTDPTATGTLDQAPVQVSITTATAKNALVVPVNALLALAGGGYAVEVVGAGGGHSLVPVTLGLFDDAAGLVQVTGSGLRAGQRVVVPAT